MMKNVLQNQTVKTNFCDVQELFGFTVKQLEAEK